MFSYASINHYVSSNNIIKYTEKLIKEKEKEKIGK